MNPQDEKNPDEPQRFENGYLQKQWTKQNEMLTIENFEKFQVDYFPLIKSDYLWKYQFNRSKIQESLEDDIFVTGYFVIKNKKDKVLYTFFVWPNHIPIIFPEVDFVIIQKEYRKLFKTVKKSGIVSFDKISSIFYEYIGNFHNEIPDLKVINQSNADKISKEFNLLKIEYEVKEFVDFIAFDRFVNAKP